MGHAAQVWLHCALGLPKGGVYAPGQHYASACTVQLGDVGGNPSARGLPVGPAGVQTACWEDGSPWEPQNGWQGLQTREAIHWDEC
jgi:hypothetical protein